MVVLLLSGKETLSLVVFNSQTYSLLSCVLQDNNTNKLIEISNIFINIKFYELDNLIKITKHK